MKVFITYSISIKDRNIAAHVTKVLEHAGHVVSGHSYNYYKNMGFDKADCDVFLAIITEKYLDTPSLLVELGSAAVKNNQSLFILQIGNVLLPLHINYFHYRSYKLNTFSEFNADDFLQMIERCATKVSLNSTSSEDDKNYIVDKSNSEKIYKLNHALLESRLTLVCGAGVSSSMGLPSWNTLLTRILNKALSSTSKKYSEEDMDVLLSSSNLIIGKYLKILLNENFDETVAKCLYEEDITLGKHVYCESELMKYIVELIRPKRNRGSVDSVITFNFDSLLEEFLDKYAIKHKAIYDEGIMYEIDEIPIYHVHGYLPRNDKIEKQNLVFSEDGYHTQFIDPYSWSNLIQLYKYMNNSCLFIGVSLSDPNLRRILDISKRKNEKSENQHFIIKKLPDKNSSVYDLEIMLEEQDALMLGLNVIWVSSYDEYPLILKEILKA